MVISKARLRGLTREYGGEIHSLACSRDITGLSNHALSSATSRFLVSLFEDLPMFKALEVGVRVMTR